MPMKQRDRELRRRRRRRVKLKSLKVRLSGTNDLKTRKRLEAKIQKLDPFASVPQD